MHAVEVGWLQKHLPARPRQCIAVRLDEATDPGGDEMRVLGQPYPNANRHALDPFELTQSERWVFRRADLESTFHDVPELDVDLVLLELGGMCDGDQLPRATLRQ